MSFLSGLQTVADLSATLQIENVNGIISISMTQTLHIKTLLPTRGLCSASENSQLLVTTIQTRSVELISTANRFNYN